MTMNERDACLVRLEKADEFLRSSHLLIQYNDWNATVGFLYHACFHAVAGLLRQSCFSVNSHNSTIVLLDKYFVKTGAIDRRYAKFYRQLGRESYRSEYEDFLFLTADDVLPLLPQTEEFIDVIKRLITTN